MSRLWQQYHRRLILAGIGLASFLVARILAWLPQMVETSYARYTSPAMVWILSHVTAILPFSVADFLIVGFWTFELGALGWTAARMFRQESRAALAVQALTRLGRDLGIVVTLFYAVWGFNYSRPDLEEQLKWTDAPPAELDELVSLATQAINGANRAYVELHHTTDLAEPTRITNLGAIEAALDASWKETAFLLGLSPAAGWKYGHVKRPLVSPVMDRLGLSGFFFPWTGEANVNRGIPAVSVPFVMAHEKAHQRGTAPENEANFLGFITALNSRSPFARYSAYMFAQSQLSFAVARMNPSEYSRLAALRVAGVQRDLDDQTEYWRRFAGMAARISDRMNDAYLKLNRVEGGITSYGRSTALIVAFARLNAGELAP